MTITKRLTILVALPLLALVGLGLFIKVQLAEIEARSRFVAETQIGSLAALGNISRGFAELRITVRSYLLGSDKAERDQNRAEFQTDKAHFIQLLRE
jgi:CHASE3 domain sensor protein